MLNFLVLVNGQKACRKKILIESNVNLIEKKCKEVYKRAYISNPNVNRGDLVVLMGVTCSDYFDQNSSVWIRAITFLSQSFSKNKVEDTFTISM